MPAQPVCSPASCRVCSPLARSLGPLERQRPRCVPVVRGVGAAAVPETRAAANHGFLFISWWRLHFSGISQRAYVQGTGKPAHGALGWAWLLSLSLTWDLGMTENSGLPREKSSAPSKPGRAGLRRQNCLRTRV